MKKTSKELVIVSDNRLLAEATGAALVSEGVVSTYIHVRNGKENDYLGTVSEEPTIVALDLASYSDRAELYSRIRWLAQELRTAQIVAIGNGESAECVTGCIESGASTFVLTRDSLDELAATVRALRHGIRKTPGYNSPSGCTSGHRARDSALRT